MDQFMMYPFALGLGTQELIIIVVIILILFGGTKIPQLMRGVGKGVGELQKGLDEGRRSFQNAANEPEDAAKNNPPAPKIEEPPAKA